MMSDESVKSGAEYPVVTFDDAAEYFTDKFGSVACELCKTSNWDILTKATPQVPGFVLQEISDFSFNQVIPLVLLQCRNCGNVKTFLERPIYNYLKAKRSKAAQGGPSDV